MTSDKVTGEAITEEEPEEVVVDMEEQEEDEEQNEENLELVDDEEDVVGNAATEVSQNDRAGGNEINIESFEELVLPDILIAATNDSWWSFINTAESREAAGEAIYAALFEGAPSLQGLFTTPRAIQAMRFMNGLASFVTSLNDPPKLKILVETLGFSHLHLDVTQPRVVIFRDAILDLFTVELGDKFTSEALDGWKRLLNYVGGAIIFVKAHYADRISVLLESWKLVNDKANNENKFKQLSSGDTGTQGQDIQNQEQSVKLAASKKGGWNMLGKRRTSGTPDKKSGAEITSKTSSQDSSTMSANQVPTTYDEMFKFNAAVMGFGGNMWLNEVLACFNNIVLNVSNSARLQEECDVLVLRISRVLKGSANFNEYKSCMLASLRSLLPKDWGTLHEVAWTWLWENVERLLAKNMGNPRKWEKALGKLLDSLDENAAFEIRKNIYSRFFTSAPAGQDFFKQSNTYLHIIAERIMVMSLELYRDPVKMVDDISALGLRHVGYGIPTELFGPFVSACVEEVQSVCDDSDAVEAFRWSLGLVAKMLVRTISEGSTIVMKAVNTNSTRLLKRAISCAPRGERAQWMLVVQVGTQDISPLSWAIESGALEAAGAMIIDLLTIRADRDRYYYSMDQLFTRHPDIIQRLCNDAPALLPKLLDGLIWRSRTTENGQRRINYYVKHLIVAENGKFSQTLSWIAKTMDPKLASHAAIVFTSDTVWVKVAAQTFMYRKSWLLFTLVVYITGQSIFKHLHEGEKTAVERYLIFSFRAFIYLLSMSQLMYTHLTSWVKAFRTNDTRRAFGFLTIPHYLSNWQEVAGFVLMISLVMMFVFEPILHCFQHDEGKLFFEECPQANRLSYPYSIFSMLAMFLYYALLLDLAVLSTKVSAYVLVFVRMLSEVGLFLLALGVVMLTFSSAMSIVEHEQDDYAGIHHGLLSLGKVTLKMFGGEHYQHYEKNPVVLTCVFAFLVCVVFFLVNMLIAQLTSAYESVYADMVGYARLERLQVIVGTMTAVRENRWQKFLNMLKLHEKIEFNAGDVGVNGGIQMLEPASANPTTIDMIRRFGGSTSTQVPWPAEDEANGDQNDRFDRLEKLLHKTFKRVTGASGRNGGSSGHGTGSGSGFSGSGREGSGESEHSGVSEGMED